MDLKEEDILGDRVGDHWYYVAKGRAMREFLRGIEATEVVDVGAGSGVFSRQLLDDGKCDRALCVDPNYSHERIETHNGKPIEFSRTAAGRSRELVLMMDVLEHVHDDVGLVRAYTDDMPPGGHVFITVPAFQSLWSDHDLFLEHHRRYTITSLESVAIAAGITPLRSRYFFGTLFPVVSVSRILKRTLSGRSTASPRSELRSYSPWINKALIAVHDLERKSALRFNSFFGLSVLCLCRKD